MNLFDILIKYHKEFLTGLLVTIKMCLWVYPVGILLGTVLGILRHKLKVFIGIPSNIMSLLLSSVPILVFLFWLHYPLQYLLGIVVDPFITSVVALSIIMTFTISDIIRNSLDNFPKELLQSAKVCGVPPHTLILRIELPLVYRQVLPNILITMVNILQATLFTSLISVNEIFRVAQQINSEIYKPVEIYTSLALFFILVCTSLNLFSYWLKTRYKWSLADL